MSRFSVLPTNITDCSTFSAVVTAGAIAMRAGSCSMPRASGLDGGGHRRREEERLALMRKHGHDPAHVVHEPHVEHAVRLVEDEGASPDRGVPSFAA